MKAEVTDLKSPNNVDELVADATGVQVKLWINKEDVGVPNVVESNESIMGGVLSVPVQLTSQVAVEGTPVSRGTNETAFTTTETLSNYAHPGGGLVVFHRVDTDTASATASFNGTPMTLLARAVFDSNRQMAAFFLDAPAATGDIVVTTPANESGHGIYAISVGENVEVRGTEVQETEAVDHSEASVSIATEEKDLVLFGLGWRNSSETVASYSPDQTEVLSESGSTRANISTKNGAAGSTTVTTTLTVNTGNRIGAVAVAIRPVGNAGNAGDPVLGVAKWAVGPDTLFFPIETTLQESV